MLASRHVSSSIDCSDISAPGGVIDTDRESCGEVFEESEESVESHLEGGDEDACSDCGGE